MTDADQNLNPSFVFINEHLPPYNKFLMDEVWKIKNAQKIALAWSRNWKILIKKEEGTKRVRIHDEQNLKDFFLMSKTGITVCNII